MGEIYGGHLVAKYLKEVEGVDTVFGLVSGVLHYETNLPCHKRMPL